MQCMLCFFWKMNKLFLNHLYVQLIGYLTSFIQSKYMSFREILSHGCFLKGLWQDSFHLFWHKSTAVTLFFTQFTQKHFSSFCFSECANSAPVIYCKSRENLFHRRIQVFKILVHCYVLERVIQAIKEASEYVLKGGDLKKILLSLNMCELPKSLMPPWLNPGFPAQTWGSHSTQHFEWGSSPSGQRQTFIHGYNGTYVFTEQSFLKV